MLLTTKTNNFICYVPELLFIPKKVMISMADIQSIREIQPTEYQISQEKIYWLVWGEYKLFWEETDPRIMVDNHDPEFSLSLLTFSGQ